MTKFVRLTKIVFGNPVGTIVKVQEKLPGDPASYIRVRLNNDDAILDPTFCDPCDLLLEDMRHLSSVILQNNPEDYQDEAKSLAKCVEKLLGVELV